MALLSIRGLTFRYGSSAVPVLEDVDLEVRSGEYLCLLGPSGCGKTTLLRHLKTALAPHGMRTGAVFLDGRPLEDITFREQAARIGFVMQNPDEQLVTDKVWHELAFGLENLGTDPDIMRLRVAEIASYFGMQGWLHRDVAQLSGGQKQLLNLAAVMALQPEVLVLDEPTAQLDPLAAEEFLSLVSRLNREFGIAVVMAEHRLEPICGRADTLAVMDGGRIVCCAEPAVAAEELYSHRSPAIAALPAPAQVFFAVGEGGRCPLTVREGRQWLEDRVAAHPPARNALDSPPFECCGPFAVEVRDLWFRYGRNQDDVLRGVDLQIPQGSLFALVGANGAGKSTLLKSICGSVKPYRGTVEVMGRKVAKWKDEELFRGVLAMVPQDPQNLFAKDTARSELLEMLPAGSGASACKEPIEEVSELCALDGLLERHPYDLSGGEQQRLALAKALLTKPRVLLLDEPAKGLDCSAKEKLGAILRGLAAQGVCIVMVSHDVEFCACNADAAALLFDGAVAAVDASRRFFGANSFYTTAASRMSRPFFQGAVTVADVVELCRS